MQALPHDPLELKEARTDVKKLRRFYSLLLTAAAVTVLVLVVNHLTSPGRWWFYWVAFGFAVAIGFSAIELFGLRRLLGPDWERRQIRKRLAQMRDER
jgi:fatty acid desaturase